MTTSEGASRMSSVRGLNASPQIAKVRPLRFSPKCCFTRAGIRRFCRAFTASAAPLFSENFDAAEVGKLPAGFTSFAGAFKVAEEGGKKFLELPGAPLDTFGVLFGPTEKSDIAVSALIRKLQTVNAKQIIVLNWLQVFPSAIPVHLGHRGGEEREARAMPSEQYAARRGSVQDGMRVIPACFARALQRWTSRMTHLSFFYFKRLWTSAKLANSSNVIILI